MYTIKLAMYFSELNILMYVYPYLIVNHFESGMNSTYAVKPGSYHTTRPRTVRQYHDALRTTYNLRAKEGFQYWLLERPKPTPCKCCMVQ